MHFKKLKVIILLLLSLTMFVSCSYFFEEKKKEKEVNYNEKTGSCISRVNQTMGFYFDSKNSENIPSEDIGQISTCYQASINAIIKYTKSGRPESGQYKAENFELLFNKMHPDVNVSLEQLQRYIKLKHFLIGGKEDSLTKKELEIIHEILPTFVEVLKEMEPYRGVLLRASEFKRDQEGYDQFNSIYKLFKFKVGLLLKEIEPYKGNRKINVKEFGQFMLSEFSDGEMESRLKYLDLLVSFKNLVINSDGDDLEINNLSNFVIQGILTYQAFSQFEYFVKDSTIFTSLGNIASFITKIPSQLEDSSIFKTVTLDSLLDVVTIVERVMVQATRGSKSQRIPFSKFNDLFIKLEAAGLTNKDNLSAQTLSEFLEGFSRKWLDPGSSNNPDVSAEKLAYIKELFLKWFDRQKILNELFAEGNATVSFHKLPENLSKNKLLLQWKTLLQNVSFLHWDDKSRVIYDSKLSNFTYRELTVSNSIRTVVELFMRPFNLNKIDALEHRVTESQAQEVYDSARVLGVEMGFMDARIFDSGKRGFSEANNFSSQRRNDSYMDYYEGYEYFAVAVSAGHLAQKIYESIDPKAYLKYPDSNHQNVTEASAFRENLSLKFSSFFDHFKVIGRYWKNANESEKEIFLKTLEIATRSGVISEKPYDLGEIRTVTTVLYYLESVINTFDLDRNGIATSVELRSAEKHIRDLMVKFILESQAETLKNKRVYFGEQMKVKNPTNEQMAKWLAPKVFIYLLKYGEVPKGFSFAFWMMLSESGEEKVFNQVQADALDILQVFSALAQVARENHVNRISDFLTKQHGFYKKGSLIKELANREAPDCKGSPRSSFCEWSRIMLCSESMDEFLYDWANKNKIFSEKLWFLDSPINVGNVDAFLKGLSADVIAAEGLKNRKELELEVNEIVSSTMKSIEPTFRTHELFSTMCSFPQLSK